MKIKKSAIKKILDAVFPSYTGRKFFLQPTEKIKFSNTNWSEGTRNTYRCYNLETGKVVSIPDFAPWANPIEGNEAALPVNALVICRAIFCGLECGITFYCNPVNAPALLGEGSK